jgi:2-oxoglutarate ferredoxin oxidoreductase subunit gamma
MEKNFIIAGFGGQGVLLTGTILASAFMFEDKNVTYYPCYGAEMRGGEVNCEVVVNEEEVSTVHKQEADIVIALNQLSFERFIPKIKKGGSIIVNSSLVKMSKPREDIKYIFAAITQKAKELGDIKTTNIISLGLLAQIEKISKDALAEAVKHVFGSKSVNLLNLNLQALNIGMNCAYQN